MKSSYTCPRFLAGTLALGLMLAIAPASAAADEQAFAEAVDQYRKAQWSDAYGRLIPLANNGHRDAARIALFMYRYGVQLYRNDWDASDEEIESWTQLASQRATRRQAPAALRQKMPSWVWPCADAPECHDR